MSHFLTSLLKPYVGKEINVIINGSSRVRGTLQNVNSDKVVTLIIAARDHHKNTVTYSLTNFQQLLDETSFDGQTLSQIITAAMEKGARGDLFSEVLLNGPSDCVLISSTGDEVPAHKLVLASRSPVFASMFSTDMIERSTNKVQLSAYTTTALKVFLQLLYNGHHPELPDYLAEMVEMFDVYRIENLSTLIGPTTLAEALTTDNAADMLFLGAKYSDPEIVRITADFVLRNKADVLASEGWQKWREKGITFDKGGLEALLQVAFSSDGSRGEKLARSSSFSSFLPTPSKRRPERSISPTYSIL